MVKAAPTIRKLKSTTTPTTDLPYLAGLDGLRALAVLAVLLYHGDMRWAEGGFLGVEVFFVVSGYLITTLLIGEYSARGRIDLRGFYLRRARRLLPAVFVLIIAVLTYAVFILPDEVARLRGDAAAAIVYLTNWYLIYGQRSYFEAVGRPSLLQHLWSLAIEEQFYLLWPLVVGFGLWLHGRQKGRHETRRQADRFSASGLQPPASSLPYSIFQTPLLIATVLCAVGSAFLMGLLYRPGVDPSRIYYGTDTRAAGLLVGAALAMIWRPGRFPRVNQLEARLLAVIGGLGLLILLWLFWHANPFLPQLYHGGFGLVALATAGLIAAVAHPRTPLLGSILGVEPLRWLGLRSYSIYLWHWPVFMLTRPQIDLPLAGLPLFLLRVVITLGLAECSYRLVEQPIRRGALGALWAGLRRASKTRNWEVLVQSAGLALVLTTFCGMLGWLVVRAQQPATPAYLAVGAVKISSGTTPAGDGVMAVAHAVLPSATPTKTPLPTTTPTPSPVPPTVLPTAVPSPEPPTQTPEPPTPTPQPKVVAIGDSVMLGAASDLVASYSNIEVDAAVSRQFQTGIDMLAWRRDNGQLGDEVVVQLGNNGPIDASQFDALMQVLKDVRRVLVLTVKVPRPWEAPNNQIIVSGVQAYPNVVLVDWYGTSINNPGYFYDDGIHLVPDGAAAYTNLVLANL